MRVLAVPLAALVLALAACGGGGGADGADGADGAGTTDEPAAVVTDAPAAPATDGGGGSTGGGPGSGFGAKPCDLITQAAVEAATGVSGMAPTPVPIDATSGLCGYRSADGSAEVVLSIWDGEAAQGVLVTLAFLADQDAEGIERVDGIGDDAIYSTADGTLVVGKGDTSVQIAVRVPALDAGAIMGAALDLGRQVADGL